MSGKEALRELLRDNRILRSHLQTWDELLVQVECGDYPECQHAISVLRELCRRVERWSHQRLQENGLYTALEQKLPGVQGLVDELRSQHNSLRRVVEDFHRELAHFNSSSEMRELRWAGEELAYTLRQHMKREETELLSVCLQELTQRGWPKPRQPVAQ